MRVHFNEHLHEYRNSNGKKYLSVTQLLSKYKTPFDRLGQAEKYVKNHPEFPMSVEQCLYAWDFLCDFALDKGNYYHDKKELEVLYKQEGLELGYNQSIELDKLENKTYPELRIYNHELGIAGHIDVCTVDYPYIDIEDYKTYKDDVSKRGFRGQKLNYVLSDIPDATYYHAAIQMNLYAYILETWGYIPRKLTIHHKPFDDRKPIPKDKVIPFMSEEEQRRPKLYYPKYNKERIIKLLEHYGQHFKESI